jgi:hypothetical protein
MLSSYRSELERFLRPTIEKVPGGFIVGVHRLRAQHRDPKCRRRRQGAMGT